MPERTRPRKSSNVKPDSLRMRKRRASLSEEEKARVRAREAARKRESRQILKDAAMIFPEIAERLEEMRRKERERARRYRELRRNASRNDSCFVEPRKRIQELVRRGGMEVAISKLATDYSGGKTPTDLISELYPKWEEEKRAFIRLVPLDKLLARCAELEAQDKGLQGVLWGTPYAVKDNIDVAGCPTTAGCPSFSYVPETSAPCVQALEAAGAIMIGKTNMDQFASGLVGTRSPFGVASNAFDSRFIPGGSSSGSGCLVGKGLVTFALGTDTAGSGRIPAMFNGCVGIKPTVGKVSTTGVVPACVSLDCVSCFATCVEDGAKVVQIMSQTKDRLADTNCKVPIPRDLPPSTEFTFAVPSEDFLSFSGPGGSAVQKVFSNLFEGAVECLEALGGRQVDIDFSPFAETASLLYGGAFVAERVSGIRSFLETGKGSGKDANAIRNDDRVLPVTRAILAGGLRFSAVDLFDDFAKLSALRARARVELDKIDLLMVPTAAAHYTVQEIASEEEPANGTPAWKFNANLGRFTNFVNLLDMCGVSVPSGKYNHPAPEANDVKLPRYSQLQSSGNPSPTLPFGVTLLAESWQDEWVWDIASQFHHSTGLGCGPEGHGSTPFSYQN